MKIAVISNSASPSKNASSLQTAKMCEALGELGHEIKLILPNTGYKKNFYKFYNIKKKFKILRIKFFKKFPIGLNYYLYALTSIYYSKYKKQDLIITRNFFVSFVLCVLNKSHIIEIHDDISIEGRVVRFLIKYLKFLNKNSVYKLITTTNSLKKKYVNDYYVDRNKIQVLHNASSLVESYESYKKFKKKKLKIGYFGSLYNSRGIKKIVELSKLDRKNNYYVFGGEVKDISNLKKKYNYTNLFFNKYLPYSKIKNELRKIDICILPYSNKITVSGDVGDISKYTSPLKIFDYMKTGKLIICSNLQVIREVLVHNKNALLINKYEDLNEWLNHIKKIKNNIKKFNEIRLNAFIFANKFDSRWRAEKILGKIKK